MSTDQIYKNHTDFNSHPLAPLFYKFIELLRRDDNNILADGLLKISEQQYIQDNRDIVAKIILEMMKFGDDAAANDNKVAFDRFISSLHITI